MPLNMQNAPMALPDFALGETARPVIKLEFQPLFDGPRKLEMVSDIVIQAPIVEQPTGGSDTDLCEGDECAPPEKERENEPPQISLGEHQAIFDDLQKRHEDELNALRETHQNEVLQQLDALQSSLFDNIAAQLENRVAEALAPLVETCFSQNTLDALVKEIRTIAGKEAVKSLRLSGPPSLTSTVKESLLDSQLFIEVEDAGGVELVAYLNDKLISTRLKEWSHKIETAIL